MIVGECKQRAVYKCYDVVGYGPDGVLEISCEINMLISKYNVFFIAVMNHSLFVHTRLMSVIATVIKHTYLVEGHHCQYYTLLPGTHMFDRASFSSKKL